MLTGHHPFQKAKVVLSDNIEFRLTEGIVVEIREGKSKDRNTFKFTSDLGVFDQLDAYFPPSVETFFLRCL